MIKTAYLRLLQYYISYEKTLILGPIMYEELKTALRGWRLETGVIVLPRDEDYTFELPEGHRDVRTEGEEIECNKCESGRTTMEIRYEEASIVIEDDAVITLESVFFLNDSGQWVYNKLFLDGKILPLYGTDDKGRITRRNNVTGEYDFDF